MPETNICDDCGLPEDECECRISGDRDEEERTCGDCGLPHNDCECNDESGVCEDVGSEYCETCDERNNCQTLKDSGA